jgi:hypothetical protein
MKKKKDKYWFVMDGTYSYVSGDEDICSEGFPDFRSAKKALVKYLREYAKDYAYAAKSARKTRRSDI